MKNRDVLLLITGLTMTLVTLGVILEDSGGSEKIDLEAQNSVEPTNSSEVKTTSEGTKYTVHPDELVQGCPSMDCIPSIDDPKFENGDKADWLNSNDRVIGLEIEGESRAYPLRIMSRHEIVNDEVSGEPVAITYCPLCRSGVTYSRELNGETLEFGVSGKLLDANLVMYDRSTETYWNQITGRAIIGERVPQRLELKFSSITSWKKWKEGHPDTKVLSRNTGIYPAGTYDSSAYRGYESSDRVGFGVDQVDDRLASKELVHGLTVENQSKAYTDEAVREEKIIQDEIRNKTVLIFESPDDGSITGMKTKNSDLEFQLEDSYIEDSEGGKWSFDGEKMNGSAEMERVTPQGFYWFAWSKFHPSTQVYKR